MYSMLEQSEEFIYLSSVWWTCEQESALTAILNLTAKKEEMRPNK